VVFKTVSVLLYVGLGVLACAFTVPGSTTLRRLGHRRLGQISPHWRAQAHTKAMGVITANDKDGIAPSSVAARLRTAECWCFDVDSTLIQVIVSVSTLTVANSVALSCVSAHLQAGVAFVK